MAPMHMAHGSQLAYSVVRASTSGVMRGEALRMRLISAWPVQSRSVTAVFSSSSSASPCALTRTAPNGPFPRSTARRATSNERRRYFASVSFIALRLRERALDALDRPIDAPQLGVRKDRPRRDALLAVTILDR